MKKVLIIFATVALLMSMSIYAFAAPGGFVSSPSGNKAPTLVESNNNAGCDAKVVVTAYGDRSDLAEAERLALEAAYTSVVNTPDVSVLNDAIKDLADAYKVTTSELAVSDLFDVSTTACSAGHSSHSFNVTLEAETLNNFVCLLRYSNGEWFVVENVTLTQEEKKLEFVEDEFSPFAIVVSTEKAPEYNTTSHVGTVIAVTSSVVGAGALAFLIIFLVRKKKSVI
ncbi:MAG: hypothetical protein J6B77_02620 [Clostridia bacterium]|nr:hypothetical protein [Clostridia bacterium]